MMTTYPSDLLLLPLTDSAAGLSLDVTETERGQDGVRLNATVPGRFAVIAFGGSGVQDKPQVITVDGNIFNGVKKVPEAFDQIIPGKE